MFRIAPRFLFGQRVWCLVHYELTFVVPEVLQICIFLVGELVFRGLQLDVLLWLLFYRSWVFGNGSFASGGNNLVYSVGFNIAYDSCFLGSWGPLSYFSLDLINVGHDSLFKWAEVTSGRYFFKQEDSCWGHCR